MLCVFLPFTRKFLGHIGIPATSKDVHDTAAEEEGELSFISDSAFRGSVFPVY